MRISAAVYEALGPDLEEIQKDMKNVKNDIKTMKSDLASLTHRVDNLTEEVDTRLSSLIEFMRNDFSGVERELSGLNSTTNMICDMIEEHDNQITTELMKINETLTDHIISNACGGTGGWRRAVYLDMTDPNTNCPSGWNMTGYSKRTCNRATDGYYTCNSVFFPVSGRPYSQVCGRVRASLPVWCARCLLGV